MLSIGDFRFCFSDIYICNQCSVNIAYVRVSMCFRCPGSSNENAYAFIPEPREDPFSFCATQPFIFMLFLLYLLRIA